MTNLNEIALKIIKEQELIIGPIAWIEAKKVKGLVANEQTGSVEIQGGKEVVDNLIKQYEGLFGRASREVCREAVLGLISQMSPAEAPASLAS